MSHRTPQDRVRDILACARNIQVFTAGMSLESFLDDPKTIRAVAFELMTIGEAVRALPQVVKDLSLEIPWEKMMGIRNVLVHEYFHLDEEILWKTATDDIPPLISMLERLLSTATLEE